MKKKLLFFLIIFNSFCTYLWSQNDQFYKLEGLINNEFVEIYLYRNPYTYIENKGNFTGYIYNHSNSTCWSVDQIKDDNNFTLIAYLDKDYQENIVISGQFRDSIFEGRCTQQDNTYPTKLSVKMNEKNFDRKDFSEIFYFNFEKRINCDFEAIWYVPKYEFSESQLFQILKKINANSYDDYFKAVSEIYFNKYLDQMNHLSEKTAINIGKSGEYSHIEYLIPYYFSDKSIAFMFHEIETYYEGAVHHKSKIVNYSQSTKSFLKIEDVLDYNQKSFIQNIITLAIIKKHKMRPGSKLNSDPNSIFWRADVPFPKSFVLMEKGIMFFYEAGTLAVPTFGDYVIFVTYDELKSALKIRI